MKRFWRPVVLMVMACAAPVYGEPAPADKRIDLEVEGDPRPVGGDEHHAWFVLPGPSDTPLQNVLLFHVPGESAPGTVRFARTLRVMPRAVAARDDSIMLAFDPRPDQGVMVREVRTMTCSRLRPDWFIYSDLAPVAPLPGEGRLLGLATLDSGVVAMIRGLGTGSARTNPERCALLRLNDHGWQPLAPPIGLDSESVWTLLSLGQPLVIIERMAASDAVMYVGLADDDGAVVWESRPVAIDRHAEVVAVAGQIMTLTRSREGRLSIGVVRESGVVEVASMDDVPSSAVAAPTAERLTLAWEPQQASLRLMTRVVTVSGAVLHDGWARLSNPVSSGEIQVLAAMLGSLILTVMIFLLKAERVERLVLLPKGVSLAEPSRRLLATAIDMVPGLLLAGTIWDADTESATLAEVGVLPLAVVAAVTIFHTTIAEWRFGRTLGKSVLGCRTLTVAGSKISFLQSLGRNTVKVLCPGLVVFMLANPFRPHPGSFGTVVVLDGPDDDESGGRRAERPKTPESGDSSKLGE